MTKTPHPYQIKARQWSNQQFNQRNNHALVMPAGSGKTYTSTLIISDRISLKKRLLVLCGTEEIFDQWMEECSNNNIDYGYINPDGIMGKNKSVYICMWQSLYNILRIMPEKFVNSFSEIITDETHHSASPTIESIYEHFAHCTRLGLTATLCRMDNKPLGKYYDTMYEPIKQSEAIEQGFLCRPYIRIPDQYKNNIPSLDELLKMSESDKKEQRAIIKDKKIIGDMIAEYKNLFNGKLCMIPCSGHEHAKLVSEMYREQGWKVEHIHGNLPKVERRRIIRLARQGKINILTTYAVGTEGLDIKNIAGVIWMRFTQSLVVWIQMNTRAARKQKNKTHYILVDPVGNSIIHGRPDIDRKWSLETDYTPGQDSGETVSMQMCPVCDNANSRENLKCWICGYNFETGLLDGEIVDKKKRKLPKFVDGELVFLDENNGGEENGETIFENGSNFHAGSNSVNSDTDNQTAIELTQLQKIEILKRDLTGVKSKNKFREGIKWL